MFYVKEKISSAVEVLIDIHDDNVFCTCPDCGCEVSVDIAQLFLAGEGDLYSTSVYCVDCSKPRLKVSSNKK